MKHFENEFGGHTFCLREVDRLDDLPAEVRALVFPHIEKAFANPRSILELVATQTTLPNLAAYLRAMISHDDWQLVIEDAFLHRRVTRAGFYWYHPKCYPTTLVFRSEVSKNREFADMFHLIDATYWDRVGCAGGILPTNEFHSLNGYCIEQTEFRPGTEPTIFATDSNGDVFVYCSDGCAGMISHETGDVLRFDSLYQCCNWIFEQLLAGEPPAFKWQQIQHDDDGSDGPFQLRLLRPED